jgi:xanthine dehydrogenase iron-sulfur cluster and FAD-binding subunit A
MEFNYLQTLFPLFSELTDKLGAANVKNVDNVGKGNLWVGSGS